MTIYSLYIFDRHCTCVYYQDWHRTKRPRPASSGALLPGVSNAVSGQSDSQAGQRASLTPTGGVVVALGNGELDRMDGPTSMSTLSFDEEAKLVYGVILSLRQMVKKIAVKDDTLSNYRTSTYKLHLYETMTGYKFVILTDPNAESLRFALRQIYTGPFLDYVVRNPLMVMDSKEQGIDNEYFRAAVDRFVRGLSMYN
ncbi:snare-like protein [Dacryopinax primogenitus]|uniref:Trafficking protein particle complex subunit n=1 Tax=Dacryopinax primogenitus (strain DJM 731) TaxID=1858805 RepID=M5GC56_DACPD|nr:snare-like protein [Dacryopinax primogenitus]EJU03677.1 snare-like protein [Dacryopinax primogenitus]